jgi:hypothetical protein
MVEFLLQNGFDWRSSDMIERTPIQIAEKREDEQILKSLKNARGMMRRGAQDLCGIVFLRSRVKRLRTFFRKKTLTRQESKLNVY